jgi:hypothetical protein
VVCIHRAGARSECGARNVPLYAEVSERLLAESLPRHVNCSLKLNLGLMTEGQSPWGRGARGGAGLGFDAWLDPASARKFCS